MSRINGCLYERRLIEKYLEEHGGKCPKTGLPMSKEDLLRVDCSTAAPSALQSPAATSIPALLQLLHGEWDALMLEQFSLRQELAAVKQELSQALYQHDAACRVIAKLVKERDVLKEALNNIKVGGEGSALQSGATPVAAEDENEGGSCVLPGKIVADIDAFARALKHARKRREVPRQLAQPKKLESFVEVDDYQAHANANGSATAVHCIAIAETMGEKLIFTGGSDAKAVVYDVEKHAPTGQLIGHTKAIRGIVTQGNFALTCSDDGSTRTWTGTDKWVATSVMRGHNGAVVGIAMLPSTIHILTVGSDGALVFTDVTSGVNIASGHCEESSGSLTCVALHPDGFMAATGYGSSVLMWDIKRMAVDLALPHDHCGTITSVAFSDNGYTMAACTSKGVVKLWDLRNTEKEVAPLVFDNEDPLTAGAANHVCFDSFGRYLAIAGKCVRLWDVSKNEQIGCLSAHTQAVTAVAWGANAHWLASASMDTHTKIFGAE